MTIALVMAQDRLTEEHGMLSRLAVGLINEGHRIVRVIPEQPEDDLPGYEQSVSLAQRIMAPMPTSYLLRKTRQIEASTALQQEHIETIVAFGKDALQLALDVKAHIHVPVLFEIQTEREARKVKSSAAVDRWFTASQSFERLIASHVGKDRTAFVPFGVRSIDQEHVHSTLDPCVVILDAAGNLKETLKILRALQHRKNVHIFIELIGKHQHKLWKQIRNLHLLGRVSCLQNVGDVRSLIVESDLLLIPNHKMQMRSVVLDAMRLRVPVICSQMQGYDMLIDEETALFSHEDWVNKIDRILNDHACSKQIGRNASDLMIEKYGSTHQIAAFEAAVSLI